MIRSFGRNNSVVSPDSSSIEHFVCAHRDEHLSRINRAADRDLLNVIAYRRGFSDTVAAVADSVEVALQRSLVIRLDPDVVALGSRIEETVSARFNDDLSGLDRHTNR